MKRTIALTVLLWVASLSATVWAQTEEEVIDCPKKGSRQRVFLNEFNAPLFGTNPGNVTLTGSAFVWYGAQKCPDTYKHLYSGGIYHGGGAAASRQCWETAPLPAAGDNPTWVRVGDCAVCTVFHVNDPDRPAQ